ncbi:MAG: ATP-binding protein, partial [Phormidesmis sp.]
MSRQQPSFTARIARSFLLLALLTVSMVGTVAYVQGRKALENAVFSRLKMTATLKEKEITRWLESCEEDFLLIAEFPTVKRDIQQLLDNPSGSEAHRSAYRRLSAYFDEISEKKPKFTQLSVQNRANQIILSTDPTLEGKYEISTNLTELEEVVAGDTFAPIFYVAPNSGKPAITYARKVYSTSGDRQGMILANLNLKRIDDIISEGVNPQSTGETYLVGRLANKTAFISREDDPSTTLPDGPKSKGIDTTLTGKDYEGEYDNYLGQRVIGVSRWLAGQDLALLAEMPTAEAFKPARRLAAKIMLVGLGAAGILFLGVSRLARQLSLSRKQIESYSRQLEKTAAEANTANLAKSEFLASMSHELRTPLNAILGFTQIMQRESSRFSPQNEYLGIISRSGEHLLNLINDVLSMAKIEAGRTTFEPVSFDLRYLLLTLEEMLRMRAEAKALQLFVQVGETVPQFIKTDEVKLRQVLVNLVGNAIKFTSSGSVTLSVSIADSIDADLTATESELESEPKPKKEQNLWLRRISFQVKDTGPGIPADELAYLFDPFYQASKTRKVQQGTGLGLAISQRCVELMGGKITVHSAAGEGSTFSFAIQTTPPDPEELPSIPIGEVVGIAPDQPAYRILIAEDVFSSRQLLVDLLSRVGFQVQAIANGADAIAAYQDWHPHLIWMDMRMPVMDGYDATRQIRAIEAAAAIAPDAKTTIIALTASAFEEERAAMLASGCDDLVLKPFRTHLIFEKMAEYLGVQYLYRNAASKHENSRAADNGLSDGASDRPTLPEQTLSQSLQPEDLAVMSPRWIARFHQAAVEVDAEALHQLISQIPAEHRHLAEALST